MSELGKSTDKTRKLYERLTENIREIIPKIEITRRQEGRNYLLNGKIIARVNINPNRIRIELKLQPDGNHLEPCWRDKSRGVLEASFPSAFIIKEAENIDLAVKFIVSSSGFETKKTSFKISERIAKAIDLDNPPKSVETVVTRIIRDYKLSRKLKDMYNFKCQICNKSILIWGNDDESFSHYIEVHHIKPLGKPHKGLDKISNMLVLCPNHHAEFDMGSIAINPEDFTIEHIDKDNDFTGKKINLQPDHDIAIKFLTYHYDNIFSS